MSAIFYIKKHSTSRVKNEDHLGQKLSRKKIAAMATSLLQRLFVSNKSDEVVSNEEEEVTTSNNGQETQIQMTLAHELYAFVADNKNEEELCNNVSS